MQAAGHGSGQGELDGVRMLDAIRRADELAALRPWEDQPADEE